MKFDNYLGIEQAKAMASTMRTLILSTACMYGVTVVVLWTGFPKAQLITWLLACLLLVAGRWFSVRSFSVDSINKDNFQSQLNTHVVWSAINGAAWGSSALFFQDTDLPILTLLILVSLAGYISIVLITNTLYLLQFRGFVICAAAPFIISFLSLEGTFYKLLLVYTLIYTVVMELFGRVANRHYIQSKRVEFHNEELLEQVTKEKELVQKAIDQKNQFLAATSHDLRQPLHALGLYINAMEPRLSDAGDLDVLGKIKDSNQALNDLLHGLLDISRLDANVVQNRPKHLSLFDITTRLIEEFDADIQTSKVEFICDIDQTHTVYVDPILTERVLRNLISNALKYTKKGFIKIESVSQEDKILTILSDSGIGVPEDKIEHIFNEFTQLDNPERDRSKGLGLGLSIVRRLCELQNIDYTFKSKLGEGSKVSLNLPIGDAALIPLIVHDPESSINNLTIVFIDDEQAIRDGTVMMIESWQCQPLIASDGKEALGKVTDYNDDIHLIISDLRLRNHENGVEVVKKIREELNQDIPAIIVTGDTAVERIELATDSNVVLMHKPIQPAELRQQVERLLKQKD